MSIDNEILSILRDLQGKATRTETKLVRGFEELGVNISTDGGWLRVNDVERTVRVNTLGRSIMVLLTEMKRAGATQVGKAYDITYAGKHVGSIVYTEV